MSIPEMDQISEVIRAQGGLVNELHITPGHSPVFKAIPSQLAEAVQKYLRRGYPDGLYRHQALGIELGLEGRNVCIATATASGKTAVFSSIVMSRLLASAGGNALVLYPAKALIADQAVRWREIADACDMTVEVIDGSVPVKDRGALIDSADVLLMTPDVLHAWLLSRAGDPAQGQFLDELRLVVMDEAHVYEGVFGTNMAYLLRRLRAVCPRRVQFIASTATVAAPELFLKTLVGVDFIVVGSEADGSRSFEKSICHVSVPARRLTATVKELIRHLAGAGSEKGKFIAFVDSRRQVEELVAHVIQKPKGTTDGDSMEDIPASELPVLPYRAGYEEHDRAEIQKALTSGKLVGVIATSALELGIDIGKIRTAVIVGVPATTKSFWQRAGRAGRGAPGLIMLLDSDGSIPAGRFGEYLARPSEANWLYLDNEYLQFANVLCAADEALMRPSSSREPFRDLPSTFLVLLDNEQNPIQPLPQDLYAMKQQAAANKPHMAFPVRTGIEKQYKVIAPRIPDLQLGTLDYAQVLNEAYPGAIYRYMARPYRVYEIPHGKSEVRTNRIGGLGKTVPHKQAMAFPIYPGGVYTALSSELGFVMESKMQISERITGFVEINGSSRTEHEYKAGSSYSQKPLNRYFDSSGVALYFKGIEYPKEICARFIARAFCRVCGVHDREIGHGIFSAKAHPLGIETVSGIVIYDSVQGSLRLTRQLIPRLASVFEDAIQLAISDEAVAASKALPVLAQVVRDHQPIVTNAEVAGGLVGGEWITVVKPGCVAVLHDAIAHINEEVIVERFVFTPQGPVYFLKPSTPGATWRVSASLLKPPPGSTDVYRYNIQTGEEDHGNA